MYRCIQDYSCDRKKFYTGDVIAGYQMEDNFDIDTEEDFLRASENINGEL